MGKNSLFRNIKNVFIQDTAPRNYFHDKEAKQLHAALPENIPTIFLKGRGMWQSGAGFFRLWQGQDGSRALMFAFQPDDLRAMKYGDRFLPAHPEDIYLAYGWEPDEDVKLNDILRAIDSFSEAVNDAIMRVGVLYETDSEKRIFRAGHVFYRLHEKIVDGEAFIERIEFGTDLEDEELANPYGRNIFERMVRKLEEPYREELRQMEARRRGNQAGKKDEDMQKLLTVQQAEAFIRHHFSGTLRETLCGRNPVRAEDRQTNRGYYAVMGALQVLQAFMMKKRAPHLPFTREEVKEVGETFKNSTGLIEALLERALRLSTIFVAGVVAFQLFSWGRRWYKAHRAEKKHFNRFSEFAGFAGTLGRLLRRINTETFSFGSVLTAPSFDAIPPIGLNVTDTPEMEQEATMAAASQVVPGMLERFHEAKGSVASHAPMRNVLAVERWLKNGIREIRFLDDGHIWRSFDAADVVDGVSPPQPVVDLLADGSVLETVPSNVPGAAPVTTRISAEEAERRFASKMRRPLGVKVPFVRPSGSESIVHLADKVASEILTVQPKLTLIASNPGLLRGPQPMVTAEAS